MFAEQASSSGVLGGGGGGGATGLLNEGGGEQQASCLVAKQAVEFPQVYTSYILVLLRKINNPSPSP